MCWRHLECYSFSVASIQIKNVPAEVHQVLRKRAATAGQSLQEYLLAELRRQAGEETLDEVLDRAGGRAGGSVGLAFAAETLRADRQRAA
jgi:antitoxin FitA